MSERESQLKRTARRKVWVAFALVLVALPVLAQSEGHVSWQARHGLGSVHRFGGVLPVAVRLEGRGARDLRLRLACSTATGQVTREVELPAGSHKELTLYVAPVQIEREITVELTEVGGRRIGEVVLPTETAGMADLVVGIVGDHPLGWNLWKHDQLRRTHLRAADLPSAVEGLSGLDVMVWAAPSLGDLTAEQIGAIGQWTERGGLLILALGPSWLESSTGAFDAWTRIRAATVLPATSLSALERIVRADLGRLDPPLAVARLAASSEQTWLKDEQGTLAAMERRGLGSVVVLGFDPSAPQIVNWPGWDRFWSGVVTRAGLRVSVDPGAGLASVYFGDRVDIGTVYQRFVSIDPRVNLPSFGWLTIWFVGYLLIIGPVEYLLLKRFNRLAWTWITFPAVVVLFSLGAYQFALANRGPEAQRARHLRTRDLLPESGVFVDRLHAGMFVERQGTVEMTVDGTWPVAQSIVRLFTQRSEYGLPWEHKPVYGQYPPSMSAKMPKWSWLMATFSGTTPSHGAGVHGMLRVDGNSLGGSIAVALGSDFLEKKIVLLSAGQPLVFSLDEVVDGEITTVAVFGVPVDSSWKQPPTAGERGEVFKRVLYETVRGTKPVHDEEPDELPDPSHDWSRLLRAGGAVLIAWKADPQSYVRVSEQGFGANGMTIVRVPIEPEMVER